MKLRDNQTPTISNTNTTQTPHSLIPLDPQIYRRDVGIDFPDPSMTKQSFVDECDINAIVRKDAAGQPYMGRINENPAYADFSQPTSYQEALNTVLQAEEQFSLLPSHIRARFQNNPTSFLEFVHDPKNSNEMITLGLATKREINDSNDKNAKQADQKHDLKQNNKDPKNDDSK